MSEPVPDPAAYQKALAGFRDALDLSGVGVSRMLEIQWLTELITKYPDETRQMLAEMDGAQ